MKRIAVLGVVAVVGAALITPAISPAKKQSKPNIVQIASRSDDFDTLVKLVKAAGLVGTLSGKTKYTVFAPTDAAFAKVPKSTLDALGKDRAKLRKVLLYHVVPGSVPASKVVGLDSANTAEGSTVDIEVKDETVYVNDAKVLKTDIRARNGIVHVIDTVLIPGS